jgi:FKBP-type peptidyl-prolyl cis-trans isomerase 2
MKPLKWPMPKAFCYLVFFCILSAAAVAGVTKAVLPGDRVTLDFTCKLSGGEIIMTSYKEIAEKDQYTKSEAYFPGRQYKPIQVTLPAEDQLDIRNEAEIREFMDEFQFQFKQALVGIPIGKKIAIEMVYDREIQVPDEERFLQMSRYIQVPKTVRMPVSEFEQIYGKIPKAGMVVKETDLLRETATDVTGGTVTTKTVRISEKRDIQTPFGNGILTERKKDFRVIIDAEPGTLVRSGPLVGRIVKKDAETFTLDYGHPFGFEKLICEIHVLNVERNGTVIQ